MRFWKPQLCKSGNLPQDTGMMGMLEVALLLSLKPTMGNRKSVEAAALGSQNDGGHSKQNYSNTQEALPLLREAC